MRRIASPVCQRLLCYELVAESQEMSYENIFCVPQVVLMLSECCPDVVQKCSQLSLSCPCTVLNLSQSCLSSE